ncbi:MAG TPA: DUF3971 domain-containing protein, partial [Marinagarivorans sp.]
LAFDPAWPVLKNAEAALLVDDLDLAVTIDEGELLGNRLRNGRVNLVKTADDKPALSITGDASGDARDALALLRASPVNAAAGEALSQFNASGDYTGSVELFIPLEGGLEGGWQDIRAQVDGGVFELPNLNLTFNDLKTDIHYHSEKGLTAKSIAATLWQQPVNGSLSTSRDKLGRTLALTFEGRAAMDEVRNWLPRPLFNYLQGSTDISGRLKLPFDHPEQGIELALSSQLEGVSLDFPAPYQKAASTAQALTLNYQAPRQSDKSYLDIDVSNVNARLMLAQSQLLAMDIGFGERSQLREGSLRLHGNLGHIDAREWGDFTLQYIDLLTQARANPNNAGGDLAPVVAEPSPGAVAPILSLGLRADSMTLGNLTIDDVALWGRELEDSWYFDLETPKAVASYQRFDNGDPSKLNFEFLHLPKPETSDPTRPQQSFLANTALEHLEPMDVSIDELAFGGQGWGHVAFDYRPQSRGLVAKRIRGNIRGLKTTDGTLAIYKGNSNQWETSFSGKVKTADVGNVLANFSYPRALISESALFDVSLNWPGHPDQLDLNNLAGTVDLNMLNGHFIQGDTGDDRSLLKLISLLNFDTLVRRLRLDFSDLSPEGLSYDRVEGKLFFENQKVIIKSDNPLMVDTTSADLQLVGDIYLLEQTIDSQLVATLPIAGNLAVAAALTAGLPAAVGVYVVGKLFKEQVNDLASVRYNVTGSWEEPKLAVDKIFEGQTQQRSNTDAKDVQLEQLYPLPEAEQAPRATTE